MSIAGTSLEPPRAPVLLERAPTEAWVPMAWYCHDVEERTPVSVYIAATGLAVPVPTPTPDQVAAGLVNEQVARRTGITSVAVAEDSGPQMAVRAAREAFAVGGHDPRHCTLHLHASMTYGGYDLWSSASYIQAQLGVKSALGLNVDQLSNGGLAALELAAGHLAGGGEGFALVTTGEKYSPPLIDRWHSDPGTVFADGGTALTLSSTGGFAEILSIASTADPDLEGIARGDDPPATGPGQHRLPASLESGRQSFTKTVEIEELLERVQDGQRRSYTAAMSNAGILSDDIDWHILPHLGLPKTRHQLIDPLGLSLDRTTWAWGATLGHLGGGDQIAGMNHLQTTQNVQPGNICVLHGVGGGFTWTTAVIRILEPAPPRSV